MEWKGVIKGVWWSNLLTTSILIIYLLTHSLTLPPAPPSPLMGKGEGDWLGGDIFEARLCILGLIPVAIPV